MGNDGENNGENDFPIIPFLRRYSTCEGEIKPTHCNGFHCVAFRPQTPPAVLSLLEPVSFPTTAPIAMAAVSEPILPRRRFENCFP